MLRVGMWRLRMRPQGLQAPEVVLVSVSQRDDEGVVEELELGEEDEGTYSDCLDSQ